MVNKNYIFNTILLKKITKCYIALRIYQKLKKKNFSNNLMSKKIIKDIIKWLYDHTIIYSF